MTVSGHKGASGGRGPVFVVGPGRSGTTLIRLLLDASSELAIGPETDLVWSALADLPGPLWNALKCPSAIVRRPSFFDRELVDYGYTPEAFADLIERARSPSELFGAFFGGYAARRGRPRWGENTPRNFQVMRRLLALYPGASFVVAHRDPRAVAYSYLRKDFGPSTVAGAAWKWFHCVRHVLDCCRDPEVDRRVLQVRYEDLVAEPEAQLGRILAFTGCPEPAAEILAGRARAEHDGVYDKRLLAPIDRSRIDYDVTPADSALVERICGALMRELGYPTGEDRGGRPRALVRRARHLAWRQKSAVEGPLRVAWRRLRLGSGRRGGV